MVNGRILRLTNSTTSEIPLLKNSFLKLLNPLKLNSMKLFLLLLKLSRPGLKSPFWLDKDTCSNSKTELERISIRLLLLLLLKTVRLYLMLRVMLSVVLKSLNMLAVFLTLFKVKPLKTSLEVLIPTLLEFLWVSVLVLVLSTSLLWFLYGCSLTLLLAVTPSLWRLPKEFLTLLNILCKSWRKSVSPMVSLILFTVVSIPSSKCANTRILRLSLSSVVTRLVITFMKMVLKTTRESKSIWVLRTTVSLCPIAIKKML